jgi:hypothetical protein
MTRMISLCCAVVATTLLPVAVSAQSANSTYCAALAQKYEQYLDMNTGHNQQPQSLDARAGVEKCKAGDVSGIPAIEKALRNAKIDLPPRG